MASVKSYQIVCTVRHSLCCCWMAKLGFRAEVWLSTVVRRRMPAVIIAPEISLNVLRAFQPHSHSV